MIRIIYAFQCNQESTYVHALVLQGLDVCLQWSDLSSAIQNIFIDGSLPNSISFIIIALLQTRVYSWRRGVHPYQKALVLNPYCQ